MEMWIMLQVYFESKLTIAAVLQGWGFQVSRTTFTPTFFTSRENEVFPQILCQIKVVEHTWLGNKVWYEINYRCTCLTTVFIKMARKRKCHRVLLTIVKIANGGAVLAAGGIIDLPCVPPGLRRDLFFCASTGAHLLTWRALGPKNIKKKKNRRWRRGKMMKGVSITSNDSQHWWQEVGADLRYCLRLLDGFPGQSYCALEWRGIVEEILKWK